MSNNNDKKSLALILSIICKESLNLDMAVSRHIRRVLEMTGGRVEGQSGAAELLGVHPGTLRHRMRQLGIPFGRMAKKNR